MSEHLCPNCKKKAFTWYMDGNDRTWWHCSSCEYKVEEDESKEAKCQKCNSPFATITFLMDNNQNYYWCGHCGHRTDLP